MDSDTLKHRAACAAIDEVRSGMVIGLGTGSTVTYFIRELGERVRQGLSISTVATSVRSANLASDLGIPVRSFREHKTLDLTVDGADEVSGRLDLVKGLGGALVREKIVARASKRLVIVVDDTKLVDRLGTRVPVPVEVLPFARELIEYTLRDMGGEVKVRMGDGKVFSSDNGNHILDWHTGPIDDPADKERRLKSMTGVVDSGIFSNMADRVIVASSAGIRVIDRGQTEGEEAE